MLRKIQNPCGDAMGAPAQQTGGAPAQSSLSCIKPGMGPQGFVRWAGTSVLLILQTGPQGLLERVRTNDSRDSLVFTQIFSRP